MPPNDHRERAGRAVAARIAELNTNAAALARQAGVSANTVRALIRGQRWPHQDTRDRIVHALGWEPGTLARIAVDGGLDNLSTVELLTEVIRRVRAMEDDAGKLRE